MVITAVALTTGGCCNKANDKVAAESQTPQMTVEKAVTGTLLGRRSIRAYKAETVPQNIMDTILLCGINAPSGMNKQPWEIRVVNDQKFLEDLTKLQIEDMKADDPHNPANDPNLRNMFRNAPTVVFIAMKDGFTSQVDCGLLAGNMVNTAWAYGIGSCIQMGPIEFLKSDKAHDYLARLNFSEGYELLMAIGFGYPDESPEAKPRDESKIGYLK